MARRPNTIAQRIALEGGDEIRKELKALGLAGEVAFRELKKSADALNKTGVDGFTKSLQRAQKNLERVGKRLETTGRQLSRAGRTLSLAITLPIVGGFTAAIKAATDFESAMADVRKVVDFPTPQAFKEMGDDIRELSLRLPVAAEGLAAITAAAGQAGVPRDELLEFTELIAQASVAFNLSAEEAGTAFAKIKTSLGLTTPEVRLLADAMNQLANNMAASETEVLQVVKTVSAIGNVAGIATKDIAAFGAAMAASNVPAEKAATGFRNLILAISAGESATSAQAAAWQQLGLDAVEVSKRIQTEGAGLIVEVLERINKLAPHVRASVLQALGGKRMIDAIAPLVNNISTLHQALGLVERESDFAGSTLREFTVRADTASNKFQLLRNNLNNLAIVIGNELLPVVVELAEKIADFVTGLSESEASVKRWGIVIAGVAAAIGPFVFALGLFITALGKFATGLAFLTRGFIALNALIATGGLAAAIAGLVNPVGAFLAVVGLLAGAIYLVSRAFGAGTEAADVHREALAKMETAISDARKGIPGAAEAVQSLGEANLQAAEAALENAEASLAMLKVQQEIEARSVNPAFGIPKDTLQLINEYQQTIRNLRLKVDETRERMALGEKAAADYAKGLSRSAGDVDKLSNAVDEAGANISKFPGPAANIRSIHDNPFAPATDGAKELGDTADTEGGKVETAADSMAAHIRTVPEEWRGVGTAARDAGTTTATVMRDLGGAVAPLEGAVGQVSESLAEIAPAAQAAVEPVNAAFAEAAASTTQLGTAAGEAFTGIEEQATTTAATLPGLFTSAAEAIADAFAAAFARIRSDLAGLTSAVTAAIARMTAELARLRAAIASAKAAASSGGGGGGGSGGGFSKGGQVFGAGTGTSDSIMARLSHGEFVIRAAAVEHFGPAFFAALNSLRVPLDDLLRGFNVGGIVDGFDRSMQSLSPVPAFADGGMVRKARTNNGSTARQPINITIAGRKFPVLADDDVARALVRVARREQSSRA